MCLLPRLRAAIAGLAPDHPAVEVPGFLAGCADAAPVSMHPRALLLPLLDDLLARPAPVAPPVAPSMVYGLFIPRATGLGGRPGTLLSALPYLRFARDRLGADTVMVLPLTDVGETNRKGSRGSPFATRDPFAIDKRLADALVPEWSAHDLYRCLVGAAARLGMRFGSIVPLATLSIDSPLLARFPDLTHWWDAGAGTWLVGSRYGGSEGAVPPDQRASFGCPPSSGDVTRVRVYGQEFFATADGRTPANAIPDVAPDMNATYTWEDVVSVNYTSLDHPVPHHQNAGTPRDETRSAWRVMPEVVAWHLRHGEQALQIDVLSSVPGEIVREGIDLAAGDGPLAVADSCCAACDTPAATPPWVLGEELWSFTAPDPVDAVVGPFVYCAAPHARRAATLVESLDHHCELLARTAEPKPFLAGVSTHDTLPLDPALARPLLLYLWLLPGSIPFVFSGAEHGDVVPLNREFGFSRAEQDRLTYDDLQMFSPEPVDWSALAGTWPDGHQLDVLRILRAVRSAVGVDHAATTTLRPWRDAPTEAAGYVVGAPSRRLAVVANFSAVPATLPMAELAPRVRSVVWAGAGAPRRDGDALTVAPGSAVALLPRERAAGVNGGRWAGWVAP